MKAIILSIGDELLIGNTLNTNSHWLGNELTEIGIYVIAHWAIPDKKETIIEYLSEATKMAQVILITGGLGPTNDDLTVESIAEFFGEPLIFHNESWEHIKEIYKVRGRVLHEPSIKMAYLPKNAIAIKNTQGTAPGSIYYKDDCMIVSMPGVPYEMKDMMKLTVLPLIKERYRLPYIMNSHIYTAGVGETILADALVDFEKNIPKNFSLAYLPNVGKVRLRISGHGENKDELTTISTQLTQDALALIGKYVYSTDNPSFEAVVGEMLQDRKLTISSAESCTGGYISHVITKVSGSSNYYKGSIISYSNEIKTSLLGVKESTLNEFGAVSEQTVSEMLSGALQQLNTDIAIAVSGVAGPTGGTKVKPVGCVYIGIGNQERQYIKKFNFTKDRERNIELSAVSSLVMLKIFLLKYYPLNMDSE